MGSLVSQYILLMNTMLKTDDSLNKDDPLLITLSLYEPQAYNYRSYDEWMTLMQGSVKVDRAVFHENVIILNEAENFKRVFKDIYKSP